MSIQNINQIYIPRQNYGFVSVPQTQHFAYPTIQNPYSASFYNQNIQFPYNNPNYAQIVSNDFSVSFKPSVTITK